MLVLFLLCAFLQTLWGKPLPPPLGPSSGTTANTTSITECQCPATPADDSQQLRSVYDIVQSCLFTIFACVWTSIHPNINGPRDSWWTRTKRRVVTTLCAVIAPEMVLLWALNQRFGAKRIADKYNKEFKTVEERETSVWAKIRQLFQPLPKSTTRHGASLRHRWTTRHGFFIQMGGFILYKNEYPEEALTYNRLAELLREGVIDAPTVTERKLQDSSKGDTISKGVVVLQTLWFVLQCIVRRAQHLPLSELEVLTLAFAVLNGAIYAAWWGKPQGVDTAIPIPLKQVEESADNSARAPAGSGPGPVGDQHPDKQPLMQSDEHMDERDSWVGRMLRKDHNRHSSPVFFLLCLPYRTIVWMLRPILKILFNVHASQKGPRMPMFYYDYHNQDVAPPEHISFVIGTIFGAIHLLGWSLEFPSPHDCILWQTSAVILTVGPFVFLVFDALAVWDSLKWVAYPILFLFIGLVPFYIVARLVVITIAFKAIAHPSPRVLLDISWTRYIPHF